MNIFFHTNLDCGKRYVDELSNKWKEAFGDHVPSKGQEIEFPFERWDHDQNRSRKFTFALRVISITYNAESKYITQNGIGSVMVELHIPYDGWSILQWEAYYKRHVEGKDY